MAPALVSVIVPVYNVAPYLEECLDSVVGQTYRNLEIIVVDDGSTDGSGAVCDEYAKKDGRIQVIHQPNRGLSAARNVGLDVAKGDHISFVDSDDAVSPVFIEALLSAGADVAQCASCRNAEGLNRENRRPAFEYLTNVEASERLQFDSTGDAIVVWNKLYRRGLFDTIRFPEGKQHEDEFVTYRVLWDAGQVAVTGELLYYYRQRSGSTTNRGFSRGSLDAIEALEGRSMFYREQEEDYLAVLTDAVACHRLRNIKNDIYRAFPEDAPFWRKHMHGHYATVMKCPQVSMQKKMALTIQMVSPWLYKACNSRWRR